MLKFFFGNVRHVTLTLDILPYYILNCAVNILQQSGIIRNNFVFSPSENGTVIGALFEIDQHL